MTWQRREQLSARAAGEGVIGDEAAALGAWTRRNRAQLSG
jgi:hypothetical protein